MSFERKRWTCELDFDEQGVYFEYFCNINKKINVTYIILAMYTKIICLCGNIFPTKPMEHSYY